MDIRLLASRVWRAAVRRPLGKSLHAGRRRSAIRMLRARRNTVTSVLFVCNGNICRSPYAAEAFRRLLSLRGSRIEVHSGGFLAPGRPAPPHAVAVARRHEVALEAHRSQPLDTDQVQAASLVVVMDAQQKQRIGERFGKPRGDILILADLLPSFGEARTIPDPIDKPVETFERVYSQIDECLSAMAQALLGYP